MPDTLTISIPRTLVRMDELVVIPRREYEELRTLKARKTSVLSATQRGASAHIERNATRGHWNSLARKAVSASEDAIHAGRHRAFSSADQLIESLHSGVRTRRSRTR